MIGTDGVYRHLGPAKVFITEAAAIHAIKSGMVVAGDVMVLICSGPLGAGMQEIYQITAALKALPFGKHVAVLTDARFSGVSTGACIGHISPEALAGGNIGKVVDGDLIEIVIDRGAMTGSVNLVGGAGDPTNGDQASVDNGTAELAARALRGDLAAHPELPNDTRLWALRWCRRAAVFGADVFTMWSRLCRRWIADGEANRFDCDASELNARCGFR